MSFAGCYKRGGHLPCGQYPVTAEESVTTRLGERSIAEDWRERPVVSSLPLFVI